MAVAVVLAVNVALAVAVSFIGFGTTMSTYRETYWSPIGKIFVFNNFPGSLKTYKNIKSK